jgi:choline dehydrogenase-like flavoprotein
MLERGDWLSRGPDNWSRDASVMLRFRREDFERCPEIAADSDAAWPFGYDVLEPAYARAEALLSVAGESGLDPTEPWRSAPYPLRPGALSPTSRRIWDAAEGLGLSPFRLPLAIDDRGGSLATAVLPRLMHEGLALETNQMVTRLLHDGSRVTEVRSVDRLTGRPQRFRADTVILAAGAISSPLLIFASGLERLNPGRELIGRMLMHHWSASVIGLFERKEGPTERFHRQVGVHDLYFGDGELGRLGAIQQIEPGARGRLAAPVLEHVTGLLVLAEDQPQARNGIRFDPADRDGFGLPQLHIRHEHSRRDITAGRRLVDVARSLLHRAGASATYVHETRLFLDALGTLRMGTHAHTSVLDPAGRFRGLENLYVTDASAFPTSAAVNPALTIAANALRIGAHVAELREERAVSRSRRNLELITRQTAAR